MERECSKQERTKSTEAAAKSRAPAAIEALVPASGFVARARRTVNWIVTNADSKTCEMCERGFLRP